jgi:hypothetical protein
MITCKLEISYILDNCTKIGKIKINNYNKNQVLENMFVKLAIT